MKYISTRGGVPPISFLEAVAMGLADDGGLLLPAEIPDVRERLPAWRRCGYTDLAYEVLRLFVGDDMPAARLRDLVAASYRHFSHPDVVPLVQLTENIHILELFHGPTLAFKDVALQFLGNLFEDMIARTGRPMNIVGATSGDTGSAAIRGVRGKAGINIFIMHPHGRVSPVQERQMTTVLDANVFNLAIRGSFDDGQRIMKELFADLDLKQRYNLTSINSVNWARVAAQVVYYFHAAFRAEAAAPGRPVHICVPTGNFGNILAGYLAWRMGAPLQRLILATNANDILSCFFNTGVYRQGHVAATLSPSMDIQVASNFERYLYYCLDGDCTALTAAMAAFRETGSMALGDAAAANPEGIFRAGSGDDDETVATIARHYRDSGYVLDPHTAVGVCVAERLRHEGAITVCLATAHPAKFAAAVTRATGSNVARHPRIDALRHLPTRCEILPAERQAVRAFICARLDSA